MVDREMDPVLKSEISGRKESKGFNVFEAPMKQTLRNIKTSSKRVLPGTNRRHYLASEADVLFQKYDEKSELYRKCMTAGEDKLPVEDPTKDWRYVFLSEVNSLANKIIKKWAAVHPELIRVSRKSLGMNHCKAIDEILEFDDFSDACSTGSSSTSM